jgi:hypothetical protein
VFTVVAVGWMARLAAPLGLTTAGAPAIVLAGQVAGAVILPLGAALATLERHAAEER